MFEGTHTDSGFVEAMENGSLRSAELRLVAWPELVARLAAARDLRNVLARRSASASGNFSCFSAGDSVADAEFLNETGHSVNPDTLAHRKDTEAKVPSTANGAAPIGRELK